MSIKDIFKNAKNLLNAKSQDINDEIESKEFIEEKNIEINESIPNVDFSTASNFARYGLAEEYYKQAISNVYNTYPYDGSEKEITNWKNNLSYFEKYIFDNEYPKSAGYLFLNNSSFTAGTVSSITASGITIASSSIGQYIKAFSGPNGNGTDGNLYNIADGRGANFEISYLSGNTIEFWYKADSNMPTSIKSASAAIFDLWNGVSSGSSTYSRFFIDLKPSTGIFSLTYKGGTTGVERAEFSSNISDLYNWHHYAFTVKNSSNNLSVKFYKDGILQSSALTGTAVTSVSLRNLIANIGAYRYTPKEGVTGFANASEYGQLAGYIDEFRYWKTERQEREISRYRFDRVYGGTNTDNSNTDLGVYYRFNEGIVGTTSINTKDAVVLDYSGRVSNGTIRNYRLNTRYTSSAIDESATFDSAEPKDPIIYSDNTNVVNKLSELTLKGQEWDNENGNAIYKTLPEWITSEDEEFSSSDLKKLTQIISSYFDKLHLQIKYLPESNFVNYSQENSKVIPYMNSILDSNGLIAPDIFIDSNIFENIKNRDEKRLFEENIYDLKNIIYKNIYNNLTYLYKSKGTEKSFRNLIRCFGIDDELIKLNIYANNTNFYINDNKKNTIIKKRVADLSTPDSTISSIVNTADVDGVLSGSSFLLSTISGSTAKLPYYLVPLTFETELYFPKKLPKYFDSYYTPDETQISLFGGYTVNNTASSNDYTINNVSGNFNFEVSFIKNNKDDLGGYFKLSSSLTNEVITSSYYSNIYDGENWNFAVRLKTPYENLDVLNYNPASLSTTTGGIYTLELYGVNTVEDNIKYQFTLSSSAIPSSSVRNIHNYGKRFFVGARRQNMTGTLLNYTDIMVSNVRFWYDYLSDEDIVEHSKNPLNYGISNPLEKKYANLGEKIERADTLAFHWDFSELTASDSSGEAYVKDVKNIPEIYTSLFAYNIERRYPGKIINTIANYSEIANNRYHAASVATLPENIYASNTINILGESDLAFTRDSRPINMFWSFEKSMYQVISEDMLNMFAGILDFNSLIGDPINKYRIEYRDLNTLREKYFRKVQNTPSLERFVDYYKWIDASIGEVLNQMAPASFNVSQNIRTMVESHALERSKVDYKVPVFKKDEKNYGQIKGIKELKYNWNKGHAPLPTFSDSAADQVSSSLWLKERAERSLFLSSDSSATSNKQTILDTATNDTNRKKYNLYDIKTQTIYNKSSYVERRLGRVVDITSSLIKIPSDKINPYNLNVGTKLTTDTTKYLRPLFSGSDSERASIYNTPVRNYNRRYEFLNGTGRDINNKYFINTSGSYSASVLSTVITGVYDYPLPNRGRTESVIVSRFSAPGGAETLSRGALDRQSETYSVYNSVNNRNLIVRKFYDSWLRETASINSDNPSYHKVDKNPLRTATNTVYNNWFVQYQIPRSDYGYAWITSSVTGVINNAGPYSSIYTNTNIGDLGILTGTTEDGLPVDFAGINTLLTKSFDLGTLTNTFTNVDYKTLHQYLLKQYGPYGMPSWQQMRTSENPIAVYNRKNNNYTFKSQRIFDANREMVNAYTSSLSSVREPPVVHTKPSDFRLSATDTDNNTDFIDLTTEYNNDLVVFGNEELNKFVKNPRSISKINNTGHKKLIDYHIKGINDSTHPKIESFSSKQSIFPNYKFVGLKENRTRPNYTEIAGTGSNGYDRKSTVIRTFWKNQIADRTQTNPFTAVSKTGSFNALGFPETSGTLYYKSLSLTASYDIASPSFYGLTKSPENYNFSIWPMDKKMNNIRKSTGIYSASSTGPYYITNYTYGDSVTLGSLQTTPERYYYFFSMPSGSYSSSTISDEASNVFTVETFKYSPNRYRVNPTLLFAYPANKSGYFFTTILGLGAFFDYSFEYKTDVLSGKTPFYNSYDDFAKDVKPLTKNYSLIPEFRISNYMDYIVSSSGGNFKSIDYIKNYNGYLNLEGRDDTTILESSDLENNINITSDIHNLPDENFELNNYKLKFTINGIKKLLPYNGFYPQQRTVQLGDLFLQSTFGLRLGQDIEGYYETSNHNTSSMSSSVSNSVGGLGAPLDAQIQTILQPFFAPGILFNTIKSGIAVDWVTVAASTGSTGSAPYYASPRSDNSLPDISSSIASYGPGGMGIRIPDFYSLMPKFLSSSTNYHNHIERYIDDASSLNLRLPFESILSPLNSIPQENKDKILYLLNPEYYIFNCGFASYISGSRLNDIRNPSINLKRLFGKRDTVVEKDARYSLAINNFLASTVDFFLQDSKLTSFRSYKQKDIPEFDTNKYYFMDVVLKKNKDFSMIVNNLTGIFQYDPDYGVGQGRYFGPTTRFYNSSTASEAKILGEAQKAVQYDTAYAPWVPPYWLGESVARIKFKPSVPVHTINEIIISSSIEYINTEREIRFKDDSNFLSYITDPNYNNNYKNSPAYIHAMNITSSINIKNVGNEKVVEYNESGIPISIKDQPDNSQNFWSIQTKFETPILNFNNGLNLNNCSFDVYITGSGFVSKNSYISSSTLGIWSGYGEIPNQGNSISVGLQESFTYSPTSNSASLLKHMGFETGFKDIGKIEDQKEISEAIVIIPYTYRRNREMQYTDYAPTINKIFGENYKYVNGREDTGPFYFKVDKTIISNIIGTNFDNATTHQIENLQVGSNDENSIKNTMLNMLKYNIPPHLDWITNRNVTPFVMYIFEFKSLLTKQDLADIWQGLMPSLSYETRLESVNIEHPMTENEFFHGKKLPEDIRFKVFKVKKKAKVNYYSLTDSFVDDKKFSFDFATAEKVPSYSYNWPYDFFSLVEAANVEVEFKYDKNQTAPRTTTINPEVIVEALTTVNSDPKKTEEVMKQASADIAAARRLNNRFRTK